MITVSNQANVDRSVTLCEASHTSTQGDTTVRLHTPPLLQEPSQEGTMDPIL